MLKGIPTVICPDLLKALAEMGHADLIVVSDDFYPPQTMTPSGRVVYAKGCTTADIIDAVLKLMPLDTEYCEHPYLHMVPDADSGVVLKQNEVWDESKKAVLDNGYKADCVGEIERMKFYEKARGAFVTVSTGDQRPYGCFILQKGVM